MLSQYSALMVPIMSWPGSRAGFCLGCSAPFPGQICGGGEALCDHTWSSSAAPPQQLISGVQARQFPAPAGTCMAFFPPGCLTGAGGGPPAWLSPLGSRAPAVTTHCMELPRCMCARLPLAPDLCLCQSWGGCLSTAELPACLLELLLPASLASLQSLVPLPGCAWSQPEAASCVDLVLLESSPSPSVAAGMEGPPSAPPGRRRPQGCVFQGGPGRGERVGDSAFSLLLGLPCFSQRREKQKLKGIQLKSLLKCVDKYEK